jgi:hypothetical protein
MGSKDESNPLAEAAQSALQLSSAIMSTVAHFTDRLLDSSQRKYEDREQQRLQARVDADVQNLFDSLRLRKAAATVLDRDAFDDQLSLKIADYVHDRNGWIPSGAIFASYFDGAWNLFQEEKASTFDQPAYTNNIEKGRYLDYLIAEGERLKDPKALVAEFIRATAVGFVSCSKRLPAEAFSVNPQNEERRGIGSVILWHMFRDQALDVNPFLGPFFQDKSEELGLFKKFRATILANMNHPSPKQPSLKNTIDTRLGGTMFRDLFDTRIPFDVPIRFLMEHSVLVAGAGHGKTQTLGALIARHLQEADPPSMVVIDSTGALIKKIQKLAVFAERLKDRIVIIDPEHDPGPALNMFDILTCSPSRPHSL